MSPGPSPTLLADWIQIPILLWLVAGCIAAAWLVILTCNMIRVWDENDAANEDAQDDHAQDVARYHCAGNGHKYMQEGDQWLCAACGDVVRRPLNCGGRHRYETSGQSLLCVVCGHRTALPYDQQKDAS